MGKLDSWSSRVSFTPSRQWSLQLSHGHLVEPEAAEPGDIDRTTASIAYGRDVAVGNWSSTLVWGRNREEHGTFNSYLVESMLNFLDRNYVFSRLELVDKSGLASENIFGMPGGPRDDHDAERESARVGALAFGLARDISPIRRCGWRSAARSPSIKSRRSSSRSTARARPASASD